MPINRSNLFLTPAAVLTVDDPPSIEQPSTKLRIAVELLLYFLLIVQVFPAQIGVTGIGFLAGALVAIGGLSCFFVYHSSREKLPATFYFVFIINVFANFSLVIGRGEPPILGDGLTDLFHWATMVLLFSYIIRNRAAEKRMLFAMALLIMVAVIVGGTEEFHYGRPRLELQDLGGTFRNANDLAYFSGLTAVCLLFMGLRSRSIVLLLANSAALVLMLICFKTVSRSGIISLGLGVILFVATTFIANKQFRKIGTVIIFIGVFIGVAVYFSQPFLLFIERLGEHSYGSRVGVYQTAIFNDLADTFVTGMGQDGAVTRGGISAHNTFLHTHIAYGGLAAYVYFIWMAWLGICVWNTCLCDKAPTDIRVFIAVIFIMMIISHVFTNRGYLLLPSIYAAATIEKYTYCYRLRLSRYIFRRDLGHA